MDASLIPNYYNITTLHPLALIALLIGGAAMAMAPRRYALVPMLVLACTIAPAQRIVFATLDFNFLRMMILMGWIRVLLHGEWRGFRWRLLDTCVVGWAFCATLVPIVHSGGSSVMVINRLGYMYDGIGLYFLVRFLVRDWDDILALARAAALLALPMMLAFLLEKATGRNFFATFGGVAEHTAERAGRLRCRGPFTHPILAGAFWCSLIPLILTLFWQPGWHRFLATMGTVCAVVVVWCTASATSTNGLYVVAVACLAYSMRHWMPWIRWGIVAGAVILHFAMNGPIWAILSKMNSITGATGWYRYKLFDDFIMHFFDWWLLGTRDFSTWWLGGRFAITSEYVLHGVRGGLSTLLFFFAIIAVGFIGVGRMLARTRSARIHLRTPNPTPAATRNSLFPTTISPRTESIIAWMLGASLLTHCAVFVGVAYFAQAILMWWVTVGMIGSLTPREVSRSAPLSFRLRTRPARESALPVATS